MFDADVDDRVLTALVSEAEVKAASVPNTEEAVLRGVLDSLAFFVSEPISLVKIGRSWCSRPRLGFAGTKQPL